MSGTENQKNTVDQGKADGAPDAPSTSWWQAFLANVKSAPYFKVTLLGALVMTLLDQMTKVWVVKILHLPVLRQINLGPVFDFTYVRNYGASFGMFRGGLPSRIFLSVLAFGIILVLINWLTTVTRPLAAAGIAFILGGAAGNLVDRVLYGYVIDFIDFSAMHFPWVFNIADTSINVGVGLLLLDAFLGRDEEPSQSGS